MHGRRRGADREKVLRVPRRDGAGVQRALTESLGERLRAEEGALHRDLLVQQHAGQQRERVAGQQLVRLLVEGEVHRGHRRVQRPVDAWNFPAARRERARAAARSQGCSGCAQASAEALTASTGQEASSRIRWALEPRISLPTGVRRRRPMTMNSASDLLGDRDQVLGGLVAADQLTHLVVDAGRSSSVLDGLELRLEPHAPPRRRTPCPRGWS